MLSNLPKGKMLMIYPEYVHSDRTKRDALAFLPVGAMYAGQLLEMRGVSVEYQDNQLHPMGERTDLANFDSYGISVMGAQNIAVAGRTYKLLLEKWVKPEQIYFGGQGIEDLADEEFQRLFLGANKISTSQLMDGEYWNISIKDQLDKFSEEDLRVYFSNELAVLLSQGCRYNCSFCGAKTGMKESFFNVKDNLESYLQKATELGIPQIRGYVTSLDFFQQAGKQGDVNVLKGYLREVISLKRKYGIEIKLRALTRADSYLAASKDEELMDLVREAGFYQFGFGADGAADISLLKAMAKGNANLKSALLEAFSHMEEHGFTPEILYVFGIEQDTEDTLNKTKELCIGLMDYFKSSIYRGFPAKSNIPVNKNWKRDSWKKTETYQELISNPKLFINLGFETLANFVSHPDEKARRLVNRYAIEMSYHAHKLGRVQSFLTIPIMETDGRELMNQESFEKLRQIIRLYAPEIADALTLENLPRFREELNQKIPKDV